MSMNETALDALAKLATTLQENPSVAKSLFAYWRDPSAREGLDEAILAAADAADLELPPWTQTLDADAAAAVYQQVVGEIVFI